MALMSLISGFPLLSVVFWDHLGLPSDPHSWTAFLLFWLAESTLCLLLLPIQYVARASPPKACLTVTGVVLFVLIQMAAPLSLTMMEIYSEKVTVQVEPFELDACDDRDVDPLFAHISDLHVTQKGSTRDGKLPGNSRLIPLLQRINERKPPFLIISGDITDQGLPTQWRLVEQLFRPLRADTKVLASTGNHDLNYFFGRDPEEHPWTWFWEKPITGLDAEPRIFRAAEFQASHAPAVQANSGATLREMTTNIPSESNLAQFPRQIAECASSCVSNSGTDPGDAKIAIASCPGLCRNDLESIRFHYFHDLAESFPLYYIDEGSNTAFIFMTTSMAATAEVGRNAIGSSTEEQIKNLKAELAKLPPNVKYIVLVQHHPLVWNGVPAFPRFHWKDILHPAKTWDAFYSSGWFLAVFLHNNIAEGEEIYAILRDELARRPGTSALVAFGHRHERSLHRLGSIILEEAPNLATEKEGDYGFYLVGTKAHTLHVAWCQVPTN